MTTCGYRLAPLSGGDGEVYRNVQSLDGNISRGKIQTGVIAYSSRWKKKLLQG